MMILLRKMLPRHPHLLAQAGDNTRSTVLRPITSFTPHAVQTFQSQLSALGE